MGLCNQLEAIVNKASKEEGLDGPEIMHELILILLYSNNVLFSYNLDGRKELTHSFKSVVTIIVGKTKMVAVKAIQPRHYPTCADKGEPIQVQASNILVLMSHQQTGGTYAMSVDFKRVGIVIRCLRIYATKVMFEDGK